MFHEIVEMSKLFLTQFTTVRFLSSMDQHVALKFTECSKFFLTYHRCMVSLCYEHAYTGFWPVLDKALLDDDLDICPCNDCKVYHHICPVLDCFASSESQLKNM